MHIVRKDYEAELRTGKKGKNPEDKVTEYLRDQLYEMGLESPIYKSISNSKSYSCSSIYTSVGLTTPSKSRSSELSLSYSNSLDISPEKTVA
jgi:hypothetical protein